MAAVPTFPKTGASLGIWRYAWAQNRVMAVLPWLKRFCAAAQSTWAAPEQT